MDNSGGLHIGGCQICTKGIGRGLCAVLILCGHTFHPQCISRHLEEASDPKCPKCGKEATTNHILPLNFAAPTEFRSPNERSQKAMGASLAFFEQNAPQNEEARQAKNAVIQLLEGANSAIDDLQSEEESNEIKQGKYQKIFADIMEFVTSHKWHLLGAIGSAVLAAVGIYLCYMYWPAVASVGVAISQKCLQMVEKVQSILKKWFPAIAVVFIGYLNMVPLFGNRCE
ncbi:ring finger domain-containing protein [Ditylenchus destructor]|uniref:Ring finger domain-containing protein n=1 Tax=Ditylenchus destructor TaxID=166010 RepID=A0AAD4N9G7_9BILA|nr:ring finger domain-containing protein [Ditylenchus destructor]